MMNILEVLKKENDRLWETIFKQQKELEKYEKLVDFERLENDYIEVAIIKERIEELEKENELEPDIMRQAIILELDNLIVDKVSTTEMGEDEWKRTER